MSGAYHYYLADEASYRNQDSSKYFGLSIFIHATLAVAALFVTVPALERMQPEPITIEVLEARPPEIKPLVLEEAKGEIEKPTQSAHAAHAPAPSSTLNAKEDVIIKAPVKKSPRAQAKMATLKTKTGGGTVPKIAKSAPSRAGVPETLEDIAAPELEAGVDVQQVGALGEDEFENDFKNVDHESEAALRAERSALDNEAKQIADEKEAALSALEEDTQAQARAMNDALEATRTKNAAALAQIRASEKAAAEKAARDEADRAAKAAAILAQKNGSGTTGRGASDRGEDSNSNVAAGSANGVRSIDQLKQVPGNPKPHYSLDERLRREQGQVVFMAFVTPDGRLTNFKLVQSTGFRNLDGKTLAALKKWKFYPGQQGWVEIPQVWTLKGDAEEMPTQLRRKNQVGSL